MPLAMVTMSGITPCVLEAPEMRAGAAEAGLHFVGDAHAAGGAHVFVGVLEIAVRKHDEAADALDGFGDEAGDLPRAWRSQSAASRRRRISGRPPGRRSRTGRDRDRARRRDARRSCAAR